MLVLLEIMVESPLKFQQFILFLFESEVQKLHVQFWLLFLLLYSLPIQCCRSFLNPSFVSNWFCTSLLLELSAISDILMTVIVFVSIFLSKLPNCYVPKVWVYCQWSFRWNAIYQFVYVYICVYMYFKMVALAALMKILLVMLFLISLDVGSPQFTSAIAQKNQYSTFQLPCTCLY